jgi:hypothetical protein
VPEKQNRGAKPDNPVRDARDFPKSFIARVIEPIARENEGEVENGLRQAGAAFAPIAPGIADMDDCPPSGLMRQIG